MKREAKNKYSGTRLKAVSPFIKAPSTGTKTEPLKIMPAYNTQGKEYKRVLPPIRDQRIINLPVLVTALQDIKSENKVELLIGGVRINGTTIILREGLCSYDTIRFRFVDVKDLLDNLAQERILNASRGELSYAKRIYFELQQTDNGKEKKKGL